MFIPKADTEEVLVDCRSVWKVFGERAPAAMRAIAERGLGKREVLQEFYVKRVNTSVDSLKA